jgi:hypothetical protein
MVNLSFAIWDKDANLLYGPAANNTLWRGLGGPCEQLNAGDPIVLYDHLADRWMLSQFAPDTTDDDGAGPYYECIAISQTGDPTGAYYRYAFRYSDEVFNDYPHFGVWPDAYYMSVNQFGDTADDSSGAGVVAYEREKMLLGLPARQVIFDLDPVEGRFRGQLAADLDGPPPPPGAPGIFAEIDDSSRIGPVDALRIWYFHVDWANPASSTFGLNGQPNQVIPTAPFTMMLCESAGVRTRFCVISPGGPLDSLGERLMFRLAYRNFGDHQVLMANHTVDATGLQQAGIRWYELRSTGGPWSIHQQSTHAPAGIPPEGRWMGAIAMDNDHNVALGYSVTGPTTFPGIRYAGRLAGDPPNSLPQSEASIIEGTAPQIVPVPTLSRWGDYSSMSIDPADDCTFWYTQEYYATAIGIFPWQTRIGAFRFPSCTPPALGTLQGKVLDSATRGALPGATVRAGAYSATTDATGSYRLPPLPAGTYPVTASAPGYATRSLPGVAVPAGGTVTKNISLTPVAVSTVTGRVIDGGGQGWPLYARIDIDGYSGGPVFTNPLTGAFSVRLANKDYRFTVTALSEGYGAGEADVTVPAASPLEFALETAGTVCPPGYSRSGSGFTQAFDEPTTPAGWTVTDNVGLGQQWRFDDPFPRGNLTGGTGGFAIVDSDHAGTVGAQDTELISPAVDFTGATEVKLEFDTDFHWFSGSLDEQADVDVSVDDGATWTNAWNRSGAEYRGPHHETVDVSALAANKPNVRVRFYYHDASFEYWWQVDNVALGKAVCTPLAGGLVVGFVTSSVGSRPGINGATVKSVKAPADTTTTFATPDDLRLGDGMFVLFSSLTGKVSFTASAVGFRPRTTAQSVPADAVSTIRFVLLPA